MIYKNINYGKVENVTVIEFGEGTLTLTNGKNKDHLSLVMKTIEKKEIGEVIGSEISSDEFKPEVVMVFNNKESFDVFYEYIELIKQDFEIFNKKH